jgi:hypothetical protein
MALEDQSPPHGAMLPHHDSQDVHRFRQRVWHRLLGKDRPWVSWRDSARAIVLSSCKSLPALPNSTFSVRVTAPRAHPRIQYSLASCRAECFSRLHPYCVGGPLQRMDVWAHLYSYVISHAHFISPLFCPRKVYRTFFQCLSCLSLRSKSSLSGVESSSRCTAGRISAT